jgi:hypothetical protein
MSDDPTPVTTTNTTTSGPPGYSEPFINQFLQGAQNRYESAAPEFFPEATYVPPSSETETGLAGLTAGAQAGSPIAQAGQQGYLSTVQGDYLNPETNPYLRATQEAAIRPVQENLQQKTLPQIMGYFTNAGRYGSNQNLATIGNAARDATRSMLDTSSNLAYRNYADERGRQQSAIQGAPDYANRRFDDYNTLLGVGQAREGYSGNQLQDAMSRYDFSQNQPQLKLGEYGGNIRQGVFGGTSTGTQTTPYFGGSNVMQGLGAGMGVAGLGLQAAGKG